MEDRYVIISAHPEHTGCKEYLWKARYHGYTNDPEKAGRFDLETAKQHTNAQLPEGDVVNRISPCKSHYTDFIGIYHETRIEEGLAELRMRLILKEVE